MRARKFFFEPFSSLPRETAKGQEKRTSQKRAREFPRKL